MLAWGMMRAGIPAKKAVLLTFLIGVFGGSADEFHQYFVPGRQCDIWDAAADAVGIALGITFWFRIARSGRKRTSAADRA